MMLYTMYSEYEMYKQVIYRRPRNCAWWEARYGLNNGKYNPRYDVHKGADLQQFTSNGFCPGISGRVDFKSDYRPGKEVKDGFVILENVIKIRTRLS